MAAGHSIHAFCLLPNTFSENLEPLAKLVNSYDTFPVDLTIHKYRAVVSLVCPSNLSSFLQDNVTSSYWVERYVSDGALEKLKSFAREHSIDAVLCESLFTVCYGIALKNSGVVGNNIPVILRAHNVESMIQQTMSDDANRPAWERIIRKRLFNQTHKYEQWAARTVDGIATVSTADADMFRRMASTTITTVVEPGVRTGEGQPASINKDQVCILASLDWVPNVSGIEWFVSEVLPRIQKEIPDVVVHIAGRNPSSRVQKLNNGFSVVVHGEVEDARQFRLDHGVFLVPLHSGSGVRIKILEALADGLPVVSTTIGAKGLRLDNGFDLLLADSSEDMAAAVVQLARNPERSLVMGKNGQTTVAKEYGHDAVADKLVGLMRR